MKNIIDGIAKTYNAEITLDYKDGYPPTINHVDPTKKVLKAANRIVGQKAGMPYLSMGGEDFAYYLQKIPGCFFFVGSAGSKAFVTHQFKVSSHPVKLFEISETVGLCLIHSVESFGHFSLT